MQYNDIKPCNWYIKQDHSYCCSVNEHQIYSHIKYILSDQGGVNPVCGQSNDCKQLQGTGAGSTDVAH